MEVEVELEQLTLLNVGEIVVCSKSSSTDFYKLPRTGRQAVYFVAGVEINRRFHSGDDFIAFGMRDGERKLVGGGHFHKEFRHEAETDLVLGYWVVEAVRRQGYGKAIIRALEARAVQEYPQIETLSAYIEPHNVGSVALAASMGYIETEDDTIGGGILVYRKRLERSR